MPPSPRQRRIDWSQLSQDARDAWPFYIILSLVVIAVFIWAVVSNPSLRSPLPLLGVSTLLLIHLALHWGSLYLELRPRWIYPYFLLQSLIIFAVAMIASGHGIVLGLYLALAGEAVGIFQDSLVRSAPVVGGILLLALITFGVSFGWANVVGWLALIVPMALFVVVYVVMYGRQARSRDEARRLLRELEAAHHQLAEYATRVEDLTLTAERQRMARELHDTLAQGLAGLILQLEAADSHLSRADAQKAGQIIQQAMGRARSTLAGARQAIANLRTGPPSPGELEEAVRTEAKRFSDATGIPCDVDIQLPARLTAPLAENALRAISEGLANAARHAEASQVWLSLHASGDAVEIKLKDDGVGFDPTEVETRGGHYGLIGLRERARLSGGSIEVQSAPGKGTTLAVRLPLTPAGETR